LYDPVLKRFLDTDPAGQGFTPYAYAGNNPIIFVDPTGMFFESIFVWLAELAAAGAAVAPEVVVTAEATTTITAIEAFTASSIVVAGITYTTSQVTTGAVIPDFANHLNYNYYGDNIWYTTEMPQNYAYDPLTGSGFEIPVDPILTPALPQSGAIEPLMIQPTDFISIPKLGAKAGIAATKAVGSSIWSKIASGAMVTTGAIASKFGVKSSQKLIGTSFTKSTCKFGQNIHKNYKLDQVLKNIREKEFRLPSGKKIDFIDFEKKIIYELKPNNPRQIKHGKKQLEVYLKEIESIYGNGWKTVLETY